jgi:hypothetical protein
MCDIWSSVQNGRAAPSLHRTTRIAMRVAMHDKPLRILRSSTARCSSQKGKRTVAAILETIDSNQVHALLATLVVVFVVVNVSIFRVHNAALDEFGEEANGRKLQELSNVEPLPFQPPQLVWLMSFPNSGTSFTSQLIRETTLTDSASNYADETPAGQGGFAFPVFADQPEGPFWIKPESKTRAYEEPSKYILTKVYDPLIFDVCLELCSELYLITLTISVCRPIVECVAICVHRRNIVNPPTAFADDVSRPNGWKYRTTVV